MTKSIGSVMVLLFCCSACADSGSKEYVKAVESTQTSYYFDDLEGPVCLQAYSVNRNKVRSKPSNKVCKNAPASWSWAIPTKNENGSDLEDLIHYELVFVREK